MSFIKNYIDNNPGILDFNMESGDEDYLYEQYLNEEMYQAQLEEEEAGNQAIAEMYEEGMKEQWIEQSLKRHELETEMREQYEASMY